MGKGKKHSGSKPAAEEELKQEQSPLEDVAEETAETPEEVVSGSENEGDAGTENGENEAAKAEASETAALEEEITKRDETIALMHDKLQRQMAEFDNFRKRTEKEKSEMFSMGASDILKKLLPVVDNFERGFNTIPDGEEKTQFAVGMDMVYKQLMKMLEDNKVTPIEAVGKEFDPQYHNAVQHVEKDDVGENIVVEEFEKGYMYGDTVLRHSMVIVAN